MVSEIHETNDESGVPVDGNSDYLPLAEFDDVENELDIQLEWWAEDEETDADELEWDEPEPLAEYDSELRQWLYVIDDYDDAALGVELRLDQWVATIGTANLFQRHVAAQLLRDIGNNRLRTWLPWLSKQQWTGESLVLFLRFRAHWESNPHWWEYSYWDWRARCWYPTRNRYSLSLEDTYQLVHLRLDCPTKEMIDEAWLADWLDLALWEHGFRSFASFALFRAGFSNGDNWIRHIDRYALDDSHSNETGSRWNNEHRLYRYGPNPWFAEQNWYEPNEWHDNLGW